MIGKALLVLLLAKIVFLDKAMAYFVALCL